MDDQTDWYAPDAATFGDRVAAAREEAGMTQKDLARRLGTRTGTLRSWEDDLSEPRANRLSMLAGLLNVSMRWLITGEGQGVSAPHELLDQSEDMRDILTEMRQLRTDLRAKAETVARLEKRLRQIIEKSDHEGEH